MQNHYNLLTVRFFFVVFFVADPPEITRRPTNQAVRVGGVASFFCAARADPPPTIVWRKNGKKVSGKK
jgi:receptor-type tyrosine-protein phosphatase F